MLAIDHHFPWFAARKRRIKVVVLAVVFSFVAGALTLWSLWDWPLITPLTDTPLFSFLQKTDFSTGKKKVVYGFLPYWNTKEVAIQPELTNLGYFSLTIGADGSLLTRIDGEGEPGYYRLTSDEFLEISNRVLQQNGKTELVLSQFNSGDIQALLASKKAQEQLRASLDSILLAFPFSGINIDIEPPGELGPNDRQRFTEFIHGLREHLNTTYSHVNLSIDVYASAASTNNIWDIKALAGDVDYIIIMAYDFHRRSSPQAGPVAPLFGGRELWDSDINSHLKEFLKVAPADKLLLGVPFYGYEWQTTSTDAQSHTFPDTGSTASYKRVQELLARKEELDVQEHWNEDALSPYLSYKEDGAIYVIYYENSRSLSYKLDYVNQLDLGGIAIWALGYEGDSRELWDIIHRKIYQ